MASSVHSPLRVVYLIDSLGSGGAQRQLLELVRHLDRKLVEPTVAIYRPETFYRRAERYRDLDVRVVPKTRRYDPAFPARLARLLGEVDADILHAFLLPAGAWALVASLAHRRTRVICSEQSDPAAGPPWWHVLRWLTFPRADLVIANSNHATRHIQRRFRLPASHVRTVYNGLDYAFWSSLPRPGDTLLGPLDARLPRRPYRAAVVGSFVWWKGHDVLTEALRLLEPAQRPAVVAAGTVQSRGVAARYDAAAAELASDGRIVRIEPLADVRALYAMVDVLILPSRFEGFPNVVLEAMAAGLPVVAAAVSDLPELIGRHRVGWTFPPGDARALAERLAEVTKVRRTPRFQAMRRRARRVARAFSIEAMVNAMVECYTAALAAGPALGRVAEPVAGRGEATYDVEAM